MNKSTIITAVSAALTLAVGFGLKKGIKTIKEKREAGREEYVEYYEGHEQL